MQMAAKRRGTAFAHSNRKFMEVPMDALELLKQDHQKVKELFKQGQQTEDKKQQKQIFKEIKSELETHARIEETIFYPAMEEHDELKDMVLESLEEHRQMKTVLRELGKLSASSERFKPKFKVLMDDVKHHAEEEEEGKMFPKIRKLIKEDELEQLGEELEAAKHKRLRKAS
jgi:hemerythrin superfamily protein